MVITYSHNIGEFWFRKSFALCDFCHIPAKGGKATDFRKDLSEHPEDYRHISYSSVGTTFCSNGCKEEYEELYR